MNHSQTSKLRINGHGHLLPYPNQIPKFMKDKEIFWVTDDRKWMCQADWKRPITDASFFLNEKLEWMVANNINKEVVLNLSQLYCNGYKRNDAKDVIRFQNDFNASVQLQYPDKFISGFVVQALFIEDALSEIERCVNELKMPILCLPTHFLSKESKWVSIFDTSTIPIFELANHYKLAIEIHPYNAEDIIQLQDQFWRFHLIWMCAQTADAYHFFSSLDFADRFPNIRSCFAHGNQFGQMGYGRRLQGFKGRPDLFIGAKSPDDNINRKNVYFDTLVHDVLSFELLIKRQGVHQVLCGLDDPYPLGEMATVESSYPGKVIDEGIEHGIITKDEASRIWCENVTAWVYGN